MRYVSATVLAASALLSPIVAQARSVEYPVTIGAVDLDDALTALSLQTGISVAIDGPLPHWRVSGVRGRMTVKAALERMLRGTDLQAVPVGSTSFRLVRRKHVHPAAPAPSPALAPAPQPDIVITGRKQSELLSNVAAPVSVYLPADSGRAGVGTTSHDVAAGTEGLTLTNVGPGRDRFFIRGLADSPFDGFSQSTVSVQIDDARITYDAVDPGLRLADVARVEVLSGPQGPLYGTGALGGVYRIVTNRPVLGSWAGSAALGMSSVAEGGLGGQAEATVNVPLLDDRIAVRAVAYASADPGWIDDVHGARNANRSFTSGARGMVRIVPADGWTVDVSGMAQTIAMRDSQYVNSMAGELTRNVPIREPRRDRLRSMQGTITGPIGTLALTLTSAFTWQDQTDILDATASARALGSSGPTTYRDERAYRVFDQEIRLASAAGARLSWVAGASYLSATTAANGDISTPAKPWSPFFLLHRRVTETALYGRASLFLAPRLQLAAGVRVFRTTTEDERTENERQATRSKALIGVTPSASLSYQLAPNQLVYLHASSALRPGGINPANRKTGRYGADRVRSLDLGTRLRLDGGRLQLNGNLFLVKWYDLQSDYLEPSGLIATRNVGNATDFGAELSVDWRPFRHWRLKGGSTWRRPRLEEPANGKHYPSDPRLPVVPDISARMQLSRDIAIGAWRVSPDIGGNLTGTSRLSFDQGLDRHVPAYVVVRTGITAEHDDLLIRFGIDNLLDSRADTFAFGNPFSIRTQQQYTPLRPRMMSLAVSKSF